MVAQALMMDDKAPVQYVSYNSKKYEKFENTTRKMAPQASTERPSIQLIVLIVQLKQVKHHFIVMRICTYTKFSALYGSGFSRSLVRLLPGAHHFPFDG